MCRQRRPDCRLHVYGDVKSSVVGCPSSVVSRGCDGHSLWVMDLGCVLIADDVNVNSAWDEFTREVARASEVLGPKLAMIVK